MTEDNSTPVEIKVYMGIGVVCLQWSLLEQTLLVLMASAENQPLEKIYFCYGGLDMLPRVNMLLRLSRYAKWPQRLVARIENIRKELQGPQGRNGLAERRNQLVHGVHAASDKPDCVSLTMVRWDGPKRVQDVSVYQIYDLASALAELSKEASRVNDDYGVWKFGPDSQQYRSEKIPDAKTGIWVKIKHYVQRIVERLFAN